MLALPPSLEIKKRMYNFFSDGYNHDSDIISFYFKNCLANRESIMHKNMSIISRNLNISIYEMLSKSKGEIQRKISHLQDPYEKWKVNFIRELVLCKENYFNSNFDNVQVQYTLDFLCLG